MASALGALPASKLPLMGEDQVDKTRRGEAELLSPGIRDQGRDWSIVFGSQFSGLSGSRAVHVPPPELQGCPGVGE